MPPPTRDQPTFEALRFFIVGGGVISLAAGMVNAITVLSVFGIPSTHMTGMLTQLAIEGVGLEHTLPFAHVAGVVGGFVTGAAISGGVLQSTRLRLSHRYGMLLLLESTLLWGATGLLMHGDFTGIVLASVAVGLQNAFATQYSGAILRTTHITGVITDVGIAIGRLVSGRPVSPWRMYLHLAILFGFGSGSIVGTLLFLQFDVQTMAIPAAIILLCAVVYWRRRAALDQVSEEIVEGTTNTSS